MIFNLRQAIVLNSFNGGNSLWEKGEVVFASFHSYGCYQIRKPNKEITDLVPVDILSFNPKNFPREQNKKSQH